MSSTWNSYEIYPGMPESTMVQVEGGSFMMGSDKRERERPIHEIYVSSFYLGQYQVTQVLWEQVMGNNPSDFKGDRLPLEMVNWYDCIEFCNKLSELEGLEPVYEIDKEAERSWEYP